LINCAKRLRRWSLVIDHWTLVIWGVALTFAPIRLLDLGEVSWLTSQAIYHGLAEAMVDGTPDTIVLAIPDAPHFCIGYHQDASVLDMDRCGARRRPIVRRQLGGGAVYLDSRQLFYQCVFHRSRTPARVGALYAYLLGPAVAALRDLGLPARLRHVNEIEVDGRRIAGTGAGQIGQASVVVGNVLFDFAFEEMIQAWRVPSEVFRAQAAEGLRRHVSTLRREGGDGIGVPDVTDALVRRYGEGLGRAVQPGALTAEERTAVARAEARLADPRWVLRDGGVVRDGLKIAAGVFVREVERPTAEGSLKVTARMREGAIDAVAIWGDAVGSPSEVKALEDALNGASPADASDLRRRLLPFGNGNPRIAVEVLQEALRSLSGNGREE
jgi:lipoate-protein ligase A